MLKRLSGSIPQNTRSLRSMPRDTLGHVRCPPFTFAAMLTFLAIAAPSRAQDAQEASVNLERRTEPSTEIDRAAALAEAPPPEPHRKGFVLDAHAGALFFAGEMGKVATPAPHFRVVFGYEPWKWLLVFVRGELAFSTTGNLEDPPFQRAFPIFGLGSGLRATVHATERVAFFGELSVGALRADIATQALVNLGLPDAEKFAPDGLARVGVEWYQLDRHFALGVAGGARLATGFARLGQRADTPLLAETQLTLRYTF